MILYLGLFVLASLSILVIRTFILIASKDIPRSRYSDFKRKAVSKKRFTKRFKSHESNRLLISPKIDIQIFDSGQ